ncbi:MAG: DUF72 domain-containing protein, partial [Paenisporosarcina sp.]
GHLRGESAFQSTDEMISIYKASLAPLIEANKLSMILVQFPPWFDCAKDNVDYIKMLRETFVDLPVAIEFRHQSWYEPQYREKTIEFLTNYEFIHSVCDEPQAGQGSIPLVPVSTNKNHSLFRLHGRNVNGWRNPGDAHKWREIRYLYEYNKSELDEIAQVIHNLSTQSKHVTVLFNNNSGGHAAKNAKQLINKLHIQYEGLNAKQLDIFEGESEWNI